MNFASGGFLGTPITSFGCETSMLRGLVTDTTVKIHSLCFLHDFSTHFLQNTLFST